MLFAVSGVEVFPLWPFASAFGISFFCSMSGISGAFLLLPYQISILGYIQPGVSATNQIFNILACPAGVWRYYRDGRLLLPLALFIALGTLPGVFIGAMLRMTLFVEAEKFMLFMSAILLYLAARLFRQAPAKKNAPDQNAICDNIEWSPTHFSFRFNGVSHKIRTFPLVMLSMAVGIAGGTYGIGGGAIMSPLLVAFFGLPIYTLAGAALFATFLTSVAGVIFYTMLAAIWNYPWAAPDWTLGLVLGLGGIGGMYFGAMLQKHAPPALLRLILLSVLLFLGATYLFKGFKAL